MLASLAGTEKAKSTANQLQHAETEKSSLQRELQALENSVDAKESCERVFKYICETTEPLLDRNTNTCLTADTLVTALIQNPDNNSSRSSLDVVVSVPISSLSIGSEVLIPSVAKRRTKTSTRTSMSARVSAITTGISFDVYRITFENGDSLSLTASHPLLTLCDSMDNNEALLPMFKSIKGFTQEESAKDTLRSNSVHPQKSAQALGSIS